MWLRIGTFRTELDTHGTFRTFTERWWTLEAFPTALRATAFGVANVAAQVCAMVTLLAAAPSGLAHPESDILKYAALLVVLGCVSLTFAHESSNSALS